MVQVVVGHGLRRWVEGRRQVELPGQTAGEVLRALVDRYPALEPQIFAPDGGLRAWVRLYRGRQDIRYGRGLAEPVTPGETLTLLLTIAGGQGFTLPAGDRNPGPAKLVGHTRNRAVQEGKPCYNGPVKDINPDSNRGI